MIADAITLTVGNEPEVSHIATYAECGVQEDYLRTIQTEKNVKEHETTTNHHADRFFPRKAECTSHENDHLEVGRGQKS